MLTLRSFGSWSIALASLPAQQVAVDEIAVAGQLEVVEQFDINPFEDNVADAPAVVDAFPTPAADAAPAAVEAGDAARIDAIIQRAQAKWKYWDSAEGPAQGWTELGFDDSQWKVGQAPLGPRD